MRRFTLRTLFSAFLLSTSYLGGPAFVFSTIQLSSTNKVSNLPQGVAPNRFIIEVDELSNIPAAARRAFTSPLDVAYASLQERGIGFDVTKEFNSAGLFLGAVLTVKTPQDAAALADTPGVVAIRPLVSLSSPQPVTRHIITGANDPTIPPDGETTHAMTGVDKLHAQGILGAGVKIGIIDSGIDYTHPLLGGGFGPGHKVIGGFDFVGDAYDGTNTPMPDSDPLDQCFGHGTHVAGIIGADPGNPFNISGVAYLASLSAYRVFGCSPTGTVTDDIIVDALLRAVQDGQDIINMSISGANGWTESTSSVVASRIARSGTVVTIAAGNDGTSGSWYTSMPGNGIDVISVGSVDNSEFPLQNLTVSGVKHDPITYFRSLPLPVLGTLPIFATSNDTTVPDDACNPLPDSTPDLSKFAVVVRRGTCVFATKLTNIAAKGGKVMLIYDNGIGFAGITVGNFNATLIQASDGEFLVEQFTAGAPVSVSFPQTGAATNFPDPTGGLMSTLSSYGPSNDFFFKPAISAPGGNIISTFPVPLGTFAVDSGTSMAAPFVAGSVALLLSVKGKSKDTAIGARSVFETTAQTLGTTKTDAGPFQTVTLQGAGLVNVFNAVHATTVISPGELILNDTANFKPLQTFTVKNTGTTRKTFKLSHVPAGTALTVRAGTIFPSDGPVPLDNTTASVVITPSSFTLNPGQTQSVIAVFRLPSSGIDKSTFPVYSGFIQITGPSVAESFHVSYIGLDGSLKDKQVVDNTDLFFGEPLPAVLNGTGNVQAGPTNYTFVNGDVPALLWRLAFGTPKFRVDLVASDTKFTPTISSRSLSNFLPFFSFPLVGKGGTFSRVKVVGPLAEFDFVSRNNEDPATNASNNFVLAAPSFANGTTIPNGSYRILVRALKVTGDPSNEADYESWLSPVIGIEAA